MRLLSVVLSSLLGTAVGVLLGGVVDVVIGGDRAGVATALLFTVAGVVAGLREFVFTPDRGGLAGPRDTGARRRPTAPGDQFATLTHVAQQQRAAEAVIAEFAKLDALDEDMAPESAVSTA